MMKIKRRLERLESGVRILEWSVPAPPIVISNFAVVNDVDKFTRYTLEQLGPCPGGKELVSWQLERPRSNGTAGAGGSQVDVNRTRQDAD